MNKELEAIVNEFKKLDEVDAVLLAGSKTVGFTDDMSDYDIYIYQNKAIDLQKRKEIAGNFATRIEINNNFWENGDEWIIDESNTGVDIMYRGFDWIADQLERVAVRNEANVGYTTCFWYNYMNSQILYDKTGQAKQLQEKYNIEYSDQLQKNIIAKNYPILLDNISSYYQQIKKALKRDDYISINHRIAEFLASYFDIVFALNKTLHPGEKKLRRIIEGKLKIIPKDSMEIIDKMLKNPNNENILKDIVKLVESLDECIKNTVK